MKKLLLILVLIFSNLTIAQTNLNFKVKQDTIFYNSEALNTTNILTVELMNSSENKLLIPLDFRSFNFFPEEFIDVDRAILFEEQEFIYPWLFVSDENNNPVYINSINNNPDGENPYFQNPILQDDTFYSEAFNYAISINEKINPYEKIEISFPISFPIVYSSSNFEYNFDLSEGCIYKIWFEININPKTYKKYLNNKEIAQFDKDKIDLFMGTIVSNKVILKNTSKKCQKEKFGVSKLKLGSSIGKNGIATTSENVYTYDKNSEFILVNKKEPIGGITLKGSRAIYISDCIFKHSVDFFQATLGHELIHSYHYMKGMNNLSNSEYSAYQYSIDFYDSKGWDSSKFYDFQKQYNLNCSYDYQSIPGFPIP